MEIKTCEEYVLDRVKTLEQEVHDLMAANIAKDAVIALLKRALEQKEGK